MRCPKCAAVMMGPYYKKARFSELMRWICRCGFEKYAKPLDAEKKDFNK